MKNETILVTGANGQIGTVLTQALRETYGDQRVIATDIRPPKNEDPNFQSLDVLDQDALAKAVAQHGATQVYHLAAILSAKGEQNPKWAWEINMNGLFNVLEVAKEHNLRVFTPSSIAVYGGQTPKVETPQHAVLQPETVYGISKVAGEHWSKYYFRRYGVDVRSIRYPGIVGYQSLPGGGTTDYAVDIYHYAVKEETYPCFLSPHTRLPMMYMEDAIRATLVLMQAPAEQIKVRTSYNLAGMSFTPAEITTAIRKQRPDFKIEYEPDFRQQIADSWPESIDDSAAREDWGWSPEFDLDRMTVEMLSHLETYYKEQINI